MNVFQSVSRAVTMTFDTFTQSLIALNHLSRSAAERTIVIEEKSIAAAARSQLKNHFDVARSLQDLYKNNSDLTQDAIDEGKAFLDRYKTERKLRETPVVVTLFKDKAKKPEATDKAQPHIPGI